MAAVVVVNESEYTPRGWSNADEIPAVIIDNVSTTVGSPPATNEDAIWIVRLVQYVLFVGSLLSLFFLLVALTLFWYLKAQRLLGTLYLMHRSIRCDRITVHIHFMVALALKSIVLVIIAEPESMLFGDNYHYRKREWTCKFVIVAQIYTYIASLNWMFIQGHYLNAKLTTNVFQRKFPFNCYRFFGWGLPLLLTSVWASIMELKYTTVGNYCWKGFSKLSLVWIIGIPAASVLVVNLLFLVNIIRVLLTKIQLTSNSTEREQFRRAAKATAYLFPLLGINNLIFFWNPGGKYQPYYMMTNAILQPLQGVLVSIFYCFICKDVRLALEREYNRFCNQNALNCRFGRQRNPTNLDVSYRSSVRRMDNAVNIINL